MKIKLAILEKDANYLQRIVSVLSTKYADKVEVYSFTDEAVALETLATSRIDVFIVSDMFDIDSTKIPARCGMAYFVDSPDIEKYNNQSTICKFQKVDLIYKRILGIYSENSNNVSGLKIDDYSTKVITFSSPNGGTGTSSMAAACAMHYARGGAKVLYLNLEKCGSADVYFNAGGEYNMSDVIYALKSRKANLSIKLESCVKQDISGVYYYSAPKVALDMFETEIEDITRMISELKISGGYNYIIIDCDFDMDNRALNIYGQSHALVWVGDGSFVSNKKILRAFEALKILESTREVSMTGKLSLIYNRFSSKTGNMIDNSELRCLGGKPRYEYTKVEQLINQLSLMEEFDKIL